MYYGESSALVIESEKGVGTCVKLYLGQIPLSRREGFGNRDLAGGSRGSQIRFVGCILSCLLNERFHKGIEDDEHFIGGCVAQPGILVISCFIQQWNAFIKRIQVFSLVIVGVLMSPDMAY